MSRWCELGTILSYNNSLILGGITCQVCRGLKSVEAWELDATILFTPSNDEHAWVSTRKTLGYYTSCLKRLIPNEPRPGMERVEPFSMSLLVSECLYLQSVA